MILKVVDLLVGFRARGEGEEHGLDLAEHGERAYTRGSRSVKLQVPNQLSDEDLDELRERLVLEATARVLENVRLGSGGGAPGG